MTLSDPNRLLRAFGLARLAVAALLLAIGPLLPEDLMPDANRPVLALTLLAVVLTSGALSAFSPVARPKPRSNRFESPSFIPAAGPAAT